MEISRKNQWVEDDDNEIPGNVSQPAKVRKGRESAGPRGRWKSTEHVNEVGMRKGDKRLLDTLHHCGVLA